MSDPPIEGLSADAALRSMGRRNLIIAVLQAAGRLILGMLFIFLVMSLVPDKPDKNLVYPVLVAIGGVVLYVLYFRRQLRGVYKARYPTLRAIEALILVAAMFLAIFSMVYEMVSVTYPDAFTEPLTSFTAYYFSLTVLATVGFGDITPVSTLARSITMVQMALDIAFVAVIIRVMTAAAKRALQQRARHEHDAAHAAAEGGHTDEPS